MAGKIKTVSVERSLYRSFMEKSEQFIRSAREMHGAGRFNVSASNSVHACISAADALCVWYLGKRSAGEKHADAVNLVKSAKNSEEFTSNAAKFSRVLSVKSLAEYDVRMAGKKDSESALINAEKFVEFVRRSLPPA